MKNQNKSKGFFKKVEDIEFSVQKVKNFKVAWRFPINFASTSVQCTMSKGEISTFASAIIAFPSLGSSVWSWNF